MLRRKNRRTREVHAELNITAFMNLMVVLVPFLLITAVFSQVSILKLDLPAGASNEQTEDDKKNMHLEVIIRSNRLVLAERTSGTIAEYAFENSDTESAPVVTSTPQETTAEQSLSPFAALNEKLQQIKADASETTTITILAEANTSYDLIIQAMDAVRMIPPEPGTDDLPGELFPDVSIGSAPADPLEAES